MKRSAIWIPALIALALLLLIARLTGLLGPSHSSESHLPRADLIHMALPQHMNFTQTVEWIGRVESSSSVDIVALEAGRIETVAQDDETFVESGAVLFTVGGEPLAGRLKTARERVESLKEQSRLAAEVVHRLQSGARQKIATLNELDAARAHEEQLRSDLADARREVRHLEAASSLTAPVRGVFTGRRVNPGQEVARGDHLAKVLAPGQVRIIATLFLKKPGIAMGRPALASCGDGDSARGTVTRIEPERTPSGGVIVWIEGGTTGDCLIPGETVHGTVSLATHTGALALPKSALVYSETEVPYIYTKAGNSYKRHRVVTGLEQDKYVEIVSGVAPTDSVVVQGAYELFYRDFNKIYTVPD